MDVQIKVPDSHCDSNKCDVLNLILTLITTLEEEVV